MADVVVIGSGPNGLVGANYLADAGHRVLVLESFDSIGGATASDRGVHPDFIHDVASTFHPLAAASPIIERLALTDFGLVRSKAPAVLGHPRGSDGWHLQVEDVAAMAELLDVEAPGDGARFQAMWTDWAALGADVVKALVTPFPAAKHVRALVSDREHRRLLRTLALPLDQLVKKFRGPTLPLLLAGNAGHSDMSHRMPGSGLMGIVLTMLGHQEGFVVPRGGAQELPNSLARRLGSLGGQIRTNAHVVGIDVTNNRAAGVVLASGERIACDAVIAGVSAPSLYLDLLGRDVVPARILRAMHTFTWDPGTVRVDWALNGPVPWQTPPNVAPGTIHLADDFDQIRRNTDAIRAGIVPSDPFIVAGQMTTSDATRSPAGTESLSAYTRIPQVFVADQAGQLSGTWNNSDLAVFADRVQSRFEVLAPGFESRILARRVWGPTQLQARNANLVNGAIGGGTQLLRNQLIFRPTLGLAGPRTPVLGVFLGSASAHPGGGVHGGPGFAAAMAACKHLASR